MTAGTEVLLPPPGPPERPPRARVRGAFPDDRAAPALPAGRRPPAGRFRFAGRLTERLMGGFYFCCYSSIIKIIAANWFGRSGSAHKRRRAEPGRAGGLSTRRGLAPRRFVPFSSLVR